MLPFSKTGRRGGGYSDAQFRTSVCTYVHVYNNLVFTVYTITRKILEAKDQLYFLWALLSWDSCRCTLGTLGQHEFAFGFSGFCFLAVLLL